MSCVFTAEVVVRAYGWAARQATPAVSIPCARLMQQGSLVRAQDMTLCWKKTEDWFPSFSVYAVCATTMWSYSRCMRCPSGRVNSLLLSKQFISQSGPLLMSSSSLTPIQLLSQQLDLHSTWSLASTIFLQSIDLLRLYLTVSHPAALRLDFNCTVKIALIAHQPCLWHRVPCHS